MIKGCDFFMNIITAYATKNDCYKAQQPMTPVGIVLHSTGANNPNLKRYVDCRSECGINWYRNHWNNPSAKIGEQCVHSFIGYDKNKKVRVANILPYNYACWGCGRGKHGSYNYNPTGHIQIELCEDNLQNKTYFNEVFKVAIEYCAMLCKQFNLKPSTIVSHAEAHKKGYASNHADCDHWFKIHGKTMDDFRRAVESLMGGFKPYLVLVTTDVLNVRSGAGTNNKIVTTVRKDDVYTIVKEKIVNGVKWGKLKSGLGYICLDYTKKL